MTNLSTDDRVWIPGDGTPEYRFALVRTADIEITLSSSSPVQPVTEVTANDGVVGVTAHPATAQSKLSVELTAPMGDGVALWEPGNPAQTGRMRPSWAEGSLVSSFSGMALRALVTATDDALITVAADAGTSHVLVRAGAVEETGKLFVAFEAGAEARDLRVHIDTNRRPFHNAVKHAAGWLRSWVASTDVYTAPTSAESPVYCTWYASHLDVSDSDTLLQAEHAAALGFGTIIIDDGWQTDEVARGYATAGDWSPSPTKFPQPAAFMRRLHDLGLRGLWWIGTPFIGDRSALAAGATPVLHREEDLDAVVLDPRMPETRKRLLGRIKALMVNTNADGVKVDFLERFAGSPGSPAPTGADFEVVEEAALCLMRQLRSTLVEIIPNPLIEFRQPYSGPRLAGLANMIRVGDCPMSDMDNRVNVADIRLTVEGVIAHSDPVMWGPDASPNRIAIALLNAFFSVPQVSVDLTSLAEPQRETVAFWIKTWREYADVLLRGEIRPHRPDLAYPSITAVLDGTLFVGRYAPYPISVAADNVHTVVIGNTDSSVTFVTGLDRLGPTQSRMFDARGRAIGKSESSNLAPFEQFDVPAGGLLVIEATASTHPDEPMR